MSVVLLGDSQLTDTSQREVTKLGPRLRSRGYEVDTLAAGGLDTRQALLGAEQMRPGDWAIYCFGANDAAPWKRIPPDEFAANYAGLLKRSPCQHSLVLGPAPVADAHAPGSRTNRETARYSDIARRVADRCQARFIALLDALGPDDIADDGVHVNDRGYDTIERLVVDVIEQEAAASKNDTF